MEYDKILQRKKAYYGGSSCAYEFAAEEYAIRKMIEENGSMLKMAILHSDLRMALVLTNRIDELAAMITVTKD